MEIQLGLLWFMWWICSLKSIDKDLCENHNKVNTFDIKAFTYSNCMENININMDQFHKDLKMNRYLGLDESINWFFSYLKIYFNTDEIVLLTLRLKHRNIDKRVLAVKWI